MRIGRKKKDEITPRNRSGKDDIVERKPDYFLSEMDHWFDQLRNDFEQLFWNPQDSYTSNLTEWNRTPAVDVADHGDRYEMNVELPGVNKEDINLEVTPYGIELSAEHEQTSDEKGKNWLRKERATSSFYRCFDMPDEVKTDDVIAEMNDGILKVTLPKKKPTPKQKSKKVNIK
ncbi:MAG: Hsp20/alpha crystallin family protein [Candidatus Thermoplasmatota archaeon]|nr:Hsp20/alpha crystallin family protein [Candidatus Thermoplasmatota archaeon]